MGCKSFKGSSETLDDQKKRTACVMHGTSRITVTPPPSPFFSSIVPQKTTIIKIPKMTRIILEAKEDPLCRLWQAWLCFLFKRMRQGSVGELKIKSMVRI